MKEEIAGAADRGWLDIYNGQLPEDWYAAFHKWSSDVESENKSSALKNLGYCYLYGKGTQVDYEKAKKSFFLASETGLHEGVYLFYRLFVVVKYKHVLRPEINLHEKINKDFSSFKSLVEEMAQYRGESIEHLYASLRRVVWLYELRNIIGFNLKVSDDARNLLEKITPEDDTECQLALAKILALQDVFYELHYASFENHSHQKRVGSVGNVSINSGFIHYTTATYKLRIINKSNLLLKTLDFWAEPQSEKFYKAKNKMISDGDGFKICNSDVVKFSIGARAKDIKLSTVELHTFEFDKFPFINITMYYKVRMKNFKKLTFTERLFGTK